jgi:hypothetical protein
VDKNFGWSTVDRRPWLGGAFTRVGHAGAPVHSFLPWKHLVGEGAEGNIITTMEGGEVAWFGRAMKGGGGDLMSSTGGYFGAGESKTRGGESCGGDWPGWGCLL